MKKNRELLASADAGFHGQPGSSASKAICKIFRLTTGRYEAYSYASSGCNQGYYQENYSYGPWRGRGASIPEAVGIMMLHVDEDWADLIRRAAQEAQYEIEDQEAESCS